MQQSIDVPAVSEFGKGNLVTGLSIRFSATPAHDGTAWTLIIEVGMNEKHTVTLCKTELKKLFLS